VGVTLGSGLGTGIIINHKLYSGTYSSAGELGLLPYLGKTVEDYCSGKFFLQEYGIKGEEVFKLAQGGDEAGLEMFLEYGKHLGNALNVLLILLSPEAIFLGGSISRSFAFFETAMKEAMNDFPFKRVLDQLVIQPSKTSNISILGAAALIVSEIPESIVHKLENN
jgi:glucokinase